MTSSHMQKMEVTEMKMCRLAYGHTLRIDNIRESLGREYHREVQENETEMIWRRDQE